MAVQIDTTKVIEVLTEVVKEKGDDYVYPEYKFAGCRYTTPDGTEPACIVGHFLIKIGVPLQVLVNLDDQTESGVTGTGWDQMITDQDLAFTPAALTALHRAQMSQDDGIPWGVALQEALQPIA